MKSHVYECEVPTADAAALLAAGVNPVINHNVSRRAFGGVFADDIWCVCWNVEIYDCAIAELEAAPAVERVSFLAIFVLYVKAPVCTLFGHDHQRDDVAVFYRNGLSANTLAIDCKQ
jgi:hypothetical protein